MNITLITLSLLVTCHTQQAGYISLSKSKPSIAATTIKNSVVYKQDGRVINIRSLGADATGKIDCTELVRKAQEKGDVYFPKGTYLMKAVDVVSNRRYFGDGMGITIIKANHIGPKTTFGISTFNFDKSGHPDRNIENVKISDLTIDFNFTDKWINFFCPIQFKSNVGYIIKDIEFSKIEFIDYAKRPHPDLINQPGKDAWCINFSSFGDSTTDILVKDCVSKAESHQFVSGGGSVLKRVKILNNTIYKPQANAITFTTVSKNDAIFDDFLVKGNTIIDPASSAILFGHDPSTAPRAIGHQIFSNLTVEDNTIILADFNVYGKSYRKNKSTPYIVNLSGGEPLLTNVNITNNTIDVKSSYPGSDIFLGKIRTYTFNRADNAIAKDFVQPPLNGTVTVTVASNIHNNKPAFQAGGYIALQNGGIYRIENVKGLDVELKVTDFGGYSTTGKRISANSKIKFLGGMLSNITFSKNKVLGNKQLRILPGGVISGLTIDGNEKTTFIMRYPSTFINNALFVNNKNFAFQKSDGSIKGSIKDNLFMVPKLKKNGSEKMHLKQSEKKISSITNLPENTNLSLGKGQTINGQ